MSSTCFRLPCIQFVLFSKKNFSVIVEVKFKFLNFRNLYEFIICEVMSRFILLSDLGERLKLQLLFLLLMTIFRLSEANFYSRTKNNFDELQILKSKLKFKNYVDERFKITSMKIFDELQI